MIRSATLFALLVLSTTGVVADEWECPADSEPELHLEAKLHKDLFCAYAFYDIRPVKDHKTSIQIKVRFALKYISFDKLEETFTLHSWVAITWQDEFLKWDPKNYGSINELQVESHELWTPRMALFNADASTFNSDSISTTCLVQSTGIVTCVPHLTHSGICRTSLRKWPYDKQNCTLYFGSWMHTGEQVNFTFYEKNPVVVEDFQNGPGWNLQDVKHDRLPGKYACCPNSTYPMLKYTFVLNRVAAGPAAIIVVPAIVIILLTLISLLLDVKNNVRLLMICFSLYGHFMFLTEIGYNIPKHSAETPIILLFLRDSMIITLVGICETLLLMSLRRRVEPAPTWIVSVNRLVSSGPGKYVVFTEFDPSNAAEVKVLTEDRPEESSRAIVDWIEFANLLNSALFIVAALTYLILIFTYIPYGSVLGDGGALKNH